MVSEAAAAEAAEPAVGFRETKGGEEMKKSTVVLIVIALIVVLLARGAVSQYNSLVALQTNVESRWAQVENQMQRRAV